MNTFEYKIIRAEKGLEEEKKTRIIENQFYGTPKGEFVIVNSSQESSHLFTQDNLKKGAHLVGSEKSHIDYSKFIGKYNMNAGVIAFVDEKGLIWIGEYNEENIKSIQEMGYEKGGLSVPHSNDGGNWIRENFQKELLGTELFERKKIDVEKFSEVFDVDIVHVFNAKDVGVHKINAEEELDNVEDMVGAIVNNQEMVVSASTIYRQHDNIKEIDLLSRHNALGIRINKGMITEFHPQDIKSTKEQRNATLFQNESKSKNISAGEHSVLRQQQMYKKGNEDNLSNWDEIFVNVRDFDFWFKANSATGGGKGFTENEVLMKEIINLARLAESQKKRLFIFEEGVFKEISLEMKKIAFKLVIGKDRNGREMRYLIFDSRENEFFGINKTAINNFVEYFGKEKGIPIIFGYRAYENFILNRDIFNVKEEISFEDVLIPVVK